MSQWIAETFVPPRNSAVAEREVDGSVHLFVEVDVPHVAVNAGVAADPELADAARAFVGVECFDQEVFFAVG